MLPTLLIGPVAIPTYPFLLLIGLWLGLGLAAWQAKRLGLDGDHVYNAGLYGLLAGVIGARLWFVLSHWNNYAGDVTQAFSLSRNALSPLAGGIIASLAVLIYVQHQKVPAALFLDALAPGVVGALVITHIGAFLGGEMLGVPSTLPWAVVISGIARHPIQLYEAALGLVSGIILYIIRAWRPWPGFHFWLVAALYSLGRLLLEIFRSQPALIEGYLAVQVMALVVLVVTLSVMAYNFTRDASL